MRKKRPKSSKRLPAIKKEIRDFLFDEEGKVSRKNVAKFGISVAMLSIMLQPQNAAGQTHVSHSNVYGAHHSGFGGTAHQSDTDHTSYDHVSHASHSNSHGSCGGTSW